MICLELAKKVHFWNNIVTKGKNMAIPGISTLYSILKRHIDRDNDIFNQRKNLSDELVENCRKWAEILVVTFDNAVEKWEVKGRDAAENEIMEQQMDFMKLDYWSIEESSPILLFLKEDSRFEAFSHSCAEFYKSALSIKRLVYGEIESHAGVYISSHDVGIRKMVELWKNEVERMLRDVTTEHMRVKVLLPK